VLPEGAEPCGFSLPESRRVAGRSPGFQPRSARNRRAAATRGGTSSRPVVAALRTAKGTVCARSATAASAKAATATVGARLAGMSGARKQAARHLATVDSAAMVARIRILKPAFPFMKIDHENLPMGIAAESMGFRQIYCISFRD
jgi:hypothetical protein